MVDDAGAHSANTLLDSLQEGSRQEVEPFSAGREAQPDLDSTLGQDGGVGVLEGRLEPNRAAVGVKDPLPYRQLASGVRSSLLEDNSAAVDEVRRRRGRGPLEAKAAAGDAAGGDAAECGGPVLKVYMYDLPRKFNFGMLERDGAEEFHINFIDRPFAELPWNSSMLPGPPGGVRRQHSIAYYLTADLLVKSQDPAVRTIAVRVRDPLEADVFLVPVFAAFSFTIFGGKALDSKSGQVERQLQTEILAFLRASPWWRRFGGRDHVIPISHPRALLHVRNELGSAILLLVDFGRYPKATARLSKDVVVPYQHVAPKLACREECAQPFEARPTLLFFQGTLQRKLGGRVRKSLHPLLKDEKDVIYENLRPNKLSRKSFASGMIAAKFCLHPAGDTPSSSRMFDAIMSRCVPVVVSDYLELPFEDAIDYTQFTVFVSEKDAAVPGHLVNLLRNFGKERWLAMWRKMEEVQHFFESQNPALPWGAVDMVWRQIYNKLPSMRLTINREKRLVVPDWWEDLTAPILPPLKGRRRFNFDWWVEQANAKRINDSSS